MGLGQESILMCVAIVSAERREYCFRDRKRDERARANKQIQGIGSYTEGVDR
jgi:hypothetical protein